MFGIDLTYYMPVIATILGFIIIQILAEFDIFHDYLKKNYDVYSNKTGRLVNIIERIEQQKWLEKMETIEERLTLLHISNEIILVTLKKLQACRESAE